MPFAMLENEEPKLQANLKVVGVGGGGCNAINSMIKQGISGVEFVAVNTDAQSINASQAGKTLVIGTKTTRGLGAGANPEVGREAAEEDRAKIEEVLQGAEMVFITAGMGGGTGTGASPVIAQVAKSIGALVVAIVTKPFTYEGPTRTKNAEGGINELKKYVDSIIVIRNAKLHELLDGNTPAFAGYDKPNEILYEATKGIAEIITIHGRINVDFADVRTVMQASGMALMGTGTAAGENRAIEAAQKAISSPLLEGMDIRGAKAMLVNITASSNLTMKEIEEGMTAIHEAAGQEVNIILGMVEKEEMNDYVSFTVIATGFQADANRDLGSAGIVQVPPVPSIFGSGSSENNTGQERKTSIVDLVFSNQASNTVDMNNLDVPTILRDTLKKEQKMRDPEVPQQKLENEGKTDESINQLKFRSNPNSVPKDEEEDRSASFLRNIMD
ncbi:MAG: cell division protein FtsZ [Ignavibacteriales bacterium]|nr:Cell division protein FtsZ [Ignavibacteriaceae bacterium]MBZ0198127.1 cell division protein FtsZ [Ignavibacteriaceae bacterium]MCZ2143104.1 cell division protein FtsZ [Ignavibacteriales bacterium]WKZ72566.1 MAG: cell division protein FtsZ [Ignavibacteriaceae bacterium]